MGGVNLYGFVSNQPISFFDPFGLEPPPNTGIEWNHNFVQEYRDEFASKGILIDKKEYGTLFAKPDHVSIHPELNRMWGDYIESDAWGSATRQDVVDHFNNNIRPAFEDAYKRGTDAPYSFNTWNGKGYSGKLKWLKDKAPKYLLALAIIADTLKAAEWGNHEAACEKMRNFAKLMLSSDELTRMVDADLWYRDEMPALAVGLGFNYKFITSTAEAGSWTQQDADVFLKTIGCDKCKSE